jgi:hypothetical protein
MQLGGRSIARIFRNLQPLSLPICVGASESYCQIDRKILFDNCYLNFKDAKTK